MKTIQNIFFPLLYFIMVINSYSSNFTPTDPYPKNPNIDAINYAFKIELSDATDEIKCELTLDLQFLTQGIQNIRLDLVNLNNNGLGMVVSAVSSDGKTLSFTHQNDVLNITLPSASSLNQRNKYKIVYHGIPATGLIIGKNKYGDRTFFSDNWPNKARNWLASIDHPYDKAMCEFMITAPNHYQVVSNGLKIEETDLTGNKRLTHWKQSVPIATWLYVIGVAKFAVQYVDEFDGKSIQTWVYHQDKEAGFYDFAEPTKKVLEFYSNYIGPFSYEKLANIQSNSVGGGMEAASAILYGDNSVTGKRSIRWRNVVIHEIAHQWFGNAVTEYDWDDVWLSEGFATYFTLLFIEHEYGRDAFVDGLQSSQERVYTFHQINPDYRIVHDNLKDMSKVTSSHTYQKGSWILHMLRGQIGTENFWQGIQNYYQKYRNSNATTDDFKRVMEEVSGQDLSTFFQQWLYQPGALEISGSWKYMAEESQIEVKLRQTQKDGRLFQMPIEIGIYDIHGKLQQLKRIEVKEKSNVYTFTVESKPEQVRLDPNLWVLMEVDFKRDGD